MQNILDPFALIFFSKEIFKHGYFETEKKPKFLKALFDLQFTYCIYFMNDSKASLDIGEELLKSCIVTIETVGMNLAEFMKGSKVPGPVTTHLE